MVDKTPPRDERVTDAGPRVHPAPSLGDSETFALLASRRRRYVLYYLANTADGTATLDELADTIEAWEEETAPEDHRDGILGSLYHIDVPKLADHGVVEYDPRSRTVRQCDERCTDLLAAMDDA
jgi:hypothetical protein